MVTEKSCNLSEQRVDLLEKKEVEPVQPVQIDINESNTYRKDLATFLPLSGNMFVEILQLRAKFQTAMVSNMVENLGT